MVSHRSTINLRVPSKLLFTLTICLLGLLLPPHSFLLYLQNSRSPFHKTSSCTSLELSEIGPKEEPPIRSKPTKEVKKWKGRRVNLEWWRKVIFRPWHFQSASFSLCSFCPMPSGIFSRENISPSYFWKGGEIV